jgi:hypothetical protein
MSPGGKRRPVVLADNLSTFPRNVSQTVQEVWKPQPTAAIRGCPGPYRDIFTFTFTQRGRNYFSYDPDYSNVQEQETAVPLINNTNKRKRE